LNPSENPEQGTTTVFCPVGYCSVAFPVVTRFSVFAFKSTVKLFEHANMVVPVTPPRLKDEVPEMVNVIGFTTTLGVRKSTFTCPTLGNDPSSSTPFAMHFEKAMVTFVPNTAFVLELGIPVTVPVVPTVPPSAHDADTLIGTTSPVAFIAIAKTCGKICGAIVFSTLANASSSVII
jgi:hypothetical protein